MWRLPLASVLLVVMSASLTGCCCCALSMSNFNRYVCRSKQSEAKINLASLARAQQSFQAEHGRYGTLEEVGFEPSGETPRYEYELLEHDEERFLAEARGMGDMAGELWQVDERGEVQALRNVCRHREAEGGEAASPPIEVWRQDPTEKLELKRAAFEVRY